MRTPASLPRRLAPFAAMLLLAGCGAGTVALQLPISNSQTAWVNFSAGVPIAAENDDVKVLKALLVLDQKTRQGDYEFSILQKNHEDHPIFIKVEDVSDDNPITWVEDTHPVLHAGVWKWQGRPMSLNEDTAKWLFEIENTIRIYRFTIRTARGHLWVLYDAASYPSFVKDYLRKQLGLDAATAAAPKPAQ